MPLHRMLIVGAVSLAAVALAVRVPALRAIVFPVGLAVRAPGAVGVGGPSKDISEEGFDLGLSTS